MKEYNKNNIPLAKELRKNMTRHEKHLWYDFLCKYVPRFQRQKAIGNYIADFYCAKARLVIELDGSQHYRENEASKDISRTEYLENVGSRVLRISNLEIDRNFEGVCRHIDGVVKNLIETE